MRRQVSDGSGNVAAATVADNSTEHAVAAKKWLLNLAIHRPEQDSNQAHDFYSRNPMEQHALSGLQVIKAESGRILCSFVVPKHLSDAYGNWDPGAIATVVDCICGATVESEEVDIEGRVIGHAGNLSAVIVEVRKKGSGHLVTVAKQWMAASLPTKSKL